MSLHPVTSIDFRTIEQPDRASPAGKHTLFTRLRQTLNYVPWAFLGILPAARDRDSAHPSAQQPATGLDDIDLPLFYECCDFSFYWVY